MTAILKKAEAASGVQIKPIRNIEFMRKWGIIEEESTKDNTQDVAGS